MKKQGGDRFAPAGNSSFILLHSSFPRRVAGECELRGQEQFAVELPGIGARRFRQAQSAKHERQKFEDVVKSAQDAVLLVLVY